MATETVIGAVQRIVGLMQHDLYQSFASRGYEPPPKISYSVRRKYIAIDVGTSGAWLVEAESGEIFNIKGYGVPDRNKKRKADIGNILTVGPLTMLAKRYQYLR